LEIVGTQGTLCWDNADGVLQLFKMPQPFGEWTTNPPAPVVEMFEPPDGFERNVMFMEQVKHFIAVAGDVGPVFPLKAGIRALEIAMAVIRKVI
jgi:predicted dehydrogenase